MLFCTSKVVRCCTNSEINSRLSELNNIVDEVRLAMGFRPKERVLVKNMIKGLPSTAALPTALPYGPRLLWTWIFVTKQRGRFHEVAKD